MNGMKYSMICRDGARAGFVGERTLYHLSFDLTLGKILHGKERLTYFLDMISKPLTDAEAIKYRQDIVRDFTAAPELLLHMRELADRLDGTRGKYGDFRRQRLGSMSSSQLSSSTFLAIKQCTASASTLLSALRFINALGELIEKYSPQSEFLQTLGKDAAETAKSEPFLSLVSLCGDLAYFSESSPIDVRVTLDRLGQICAADLIGHEHIFITDPDLKQKPTWTRRRAESKIYPCERAILPQKEVDKLFPMPFFELANLIDSITKQIFDRYGELSRELVFYEAAAEYCAFLADRGVCRTFPTFSDGGISVCELCDLQLLADREDISDIVPNGIESDLPDERTVIYGDNGCGKTTFLRSAAMMQLLAQAGLPVPARSARLRIYPAILTQFAEAEKEFEAGNEAGRFEQEVRELAKVIDTAPRGSLVILNETFQTTSYEEGAAGLCGILRYLSDCGISYMLATHMMQLYPIMSGNAVFFRVNEHHEVRRIDRA